MFKSAIFYSFIWVVIIQSCQKNSQKTLSDTNRKDSLSLYNNVITKDSFDITIDSTLIAGQKFVAVFKYDFNNCENEFKIVNKLGDIVYSRYDCVNSFEFVDFNEDGYNDIRFDYITNVPGINNLAMFNPKENCFVDIATFDSYPASQKIKKSDFYYSYSRAGCADFNWVSDLYYIKNYEIFPVGHINGIGCESDDDTMGIYVYKSADTVQALVKTYPIDTITKLDGYKWEFIEKYWTKNYREFVN